MGWNKIGRWIQQLCVVLVLSTSLFVALNLAIAAMIETQLLPLRSVKPDPYWTEQKAQQWIDHYGLDILRRVYPGKSDEQLKTVVRAKFQTGNRYAPFVEFEHEPIFINDYGIHEAGFRLGGSEQGPWPPDPKAINVFVFGGSTTFGVGMGDEETMPAHLQAALRKATGRFVNAYNFGVGAYYSSQELINFWRQARQGFTPDLVVFLDGLNDYFQTTDDTAHSGYYREFEKVVTSYQKELKEDKGALWHIQKAFLLSPMVRLAARLKTHELPTATPGAEVLSPSATTAVRTFTRDDDKHIRFATDRLLNNWRMAAGMAEGIGASSAFVVQPTPVWAYDLHRHPFVVPEWHQFTRVGYPHLKERLARSTPGENVVWCADIAAEIPNGEAARQAMPLYVDPVHYSAAMNRLIAQCITESLSRTAVLTRLASRQK